MNEAMEGSPEGTATPGDAPSSPQTDGPRHPSGHASRSARPGRPGQSSRAKRARRRGRSTRAASRARRLRERPVAPDPPELWQRATEAYPGAIVLEDLERTPADAAAAQRIVARFAALRVVLMTLDRGLERRVEDDLARPDIAEERETAQTYVDALPVDDAERRALDRMMAAALSDRPRDLAIQALEAADHAASRGHAAGAYRLYRTAYTVSQPRRWISEALRAARAVAAAARAARAPRATRAWRRRIRRLQRLERATAEAQRVATAEE